MTYIQLCDLRGVSIGVQHERDNRASSSGRQKKLKRSEKEERHEEEEKEATF